MDEYAPAEPPTQMLGVSTSGSTAGGVAGPGLKENAYSICANLTADIPGCRNSSTEDIDPLLEQTVSLLVPLIFGLIVVVGLFGNALVVLVVAANPQMRSTTNLLIINLAVADLLFIVFCVPFTATDYALPCWPFGDTWCQVVQYLIVVTSMASVYTLVLMSLDRYLAVVFPVKSMSIRTEFNATVAILVMWIIILLTSIPAYNGHDVVYYTHDGVNKSSCVFVDNSFTVMFAYQFGFFLKAYVVPLCLTAGLYILMIMRLWRGVAPGGRLSAESRRGKKRVTRMVVVVVAIFALCWAPIQVILLLKSMHMYRLTTFSVSLQIVGQILAYMNSCVNPILYAFLSENFRKAFRKVMSCGPLQFIATPDNRNGRNVVKKDGGQSIGADKPTRTTRTNGGGFDIL